jgi:HD-GYP domain-containing protein (c-di-GMP phosphodiesterase class II)
MNVNNIRKEKTDISQLGVGMYVCELDRPWLGTPFLLEGILIEDDAQIATLKTLCEFVYVDYTLSIGEFYIAPPKEDVGIKRDSTIVRVTVAPQQKTTPHKAPQNTRPVELKPANNKFSFFEILRELSQSNQQPAQQARNGSSTTSTADFGISDSRSVKPNIDNTYHDLKKPEELASPTLASQIKADFSNFISGLTSWGGKSKKLGTSIDKAAVKADANQFPETQNGDRITIYEEGPLVEEEIAAIYPVYEQSQIATKEIFEALALDQKIDLTKVNDALNGMVDSIERNPDALIWLAKLKQTDDIAYNHALNVSITLMALANFMALPRKQVKELGLAGLLQDIGKAKIPTELLHKETKITEEEFDLLKKHVDHALELLQVTDNISGTVILTVSQHHERINGSGYPYQLKGKQISLTGQMAGLIDTYCALTSNKVYAKGVYNQLALEEIYSMRDTKFSSALIDQLVQFLGIYPVSSLVELNTGEVGVVIQQNSVRRLLPRVMILLNPDKSKNESPVTLNLINAPPTPTGEPYRIVRGLAPDSYGLNANNFYA